LVDRRVSFGLRVRRGGAYFRLADPGWENPLDTSSSRAVGGRWNAPGAFAVLYLNATVPMARLQVAHKLAGQPYAIEDLDESEQHDLVSVEVPEGDQLDCLSDEGLAAVGLPAGYPLDPAGVSIRWDTCQPIGQAAYSAGAPGIACRSGVSGATAHDEELGVFDHEAANVAMTDRRPFAEWYWT
jgi:hypothetical protein